MYTIAYLEKNGKGFADNCPWIVMPPFETLAGCQQDADKMIRQGYQRVTVFRCSYSLARLLEETTVCWDYIKRNQVRCAGARADLAQASVRLVG